MVKNISNPVNARKVAGILASDIERLGNQVSERDISVFLSDNNFDNIFSAINVLKSKELIPDRFSLTEEGIAELEENEFLEHGATESGSNTDSNSRTSTIRISFKERPLEFKTQFESLKNKVVKSWSGGLQSTRLDYDKFNRAFSRPMEQLTNEMKADGINITDLQAYAVIFGTEYLGLAETNLKATYHSLFGRYESIRETLDKNYGIRYTWPDASGSMFIQRGQKYTVALEIADLGRKIQSVSGLDTYSDEVIQELFLQLLDGSLNNELIEKKMVFRWSEDDYKDNPFDWVIPQISDNVLREAKNQFIECSVSHLILSKLESNSETLLELLQSTSGMETPQRLDYLVNKLEHALTRKSANIQYGTALANSFENFKTNPCNSEVFIETMYRYYLKSEAMQPVVMTMRHNIITGLKISSGLVREYLKELSNEELENQIDEVIFKSLELAFLAHNMLEEFAELIEQRNLESLFSLLDFKSITLNEDEIKRLFVSIVDNTYHLTKNFVDGLRPQRIDVSDSEGGLKELTHDFLSTVIYHANKNPNVQELVKQTVSEGVPQEIAEIIVHITNYATYQIAGREGDNGIIFHRSLVEFYQNRFIAIKGRFQQIFSTEESFALFKKYFIDELTQVYVLINIASKLKTDIFNAWTPIQSSKEKSIFYLIRFIVPNLIYWQRLPKKFVEKLIEDGVITAVEIPVLIELFGRFSMVDAYSLFVMTIYPYVNQYEDAETQLKMIFQVNGDLHKALKLRPRYGEAEIAKQTSILWFNLLEKPAEKESEI